MWGPAQGQNNQSLRLLDAAHGAASRPAAALAPDRTLVWSSPHRPRDAATLGPPSLRPSVVALRRAREARALRHAPHDNGRGVEDKPSS